MRGYALERGVQGSAGGNALPHGFTTPDPGVVSKCALWDRRRRSLQGDCITGDLIGQHRHDTI